MMSKKSTLVSVKQSLVRNPRLYSVIVVLCVAMIGSFALYAARAATPFVSAEAEVGTVSGAACSASDSTASGGSAVRFGCTPVAPVVGTGTTYKATFMTSVTGGGAMPNWTSNVVTAACAGDGVTDDRACLQAAANAARDQQKPLVIPMKASFYRITGPVTVYGSVGGVGGMPTITMTNMSATWGAAKMMLLNAGMTGWIYNLHLVGTFNGTNQVTEHHHQIDVGNVNGVTISGNLLENAMGDSISTDISQNGGGSGWAENVIVDGNTMRNPYRCAIAFVQYQRNWVITNNVIDKQVNYVSGIDFEPEGGAQVRYVEVAYNKFVMNNRTVNLNRSSDGQAVSGWRVAFGTSTTAGGDYWLHHNYGTFGTGFSGFGPDGWGPIYQASNVEGSNVPN